MNKTIVERYQQAQAINQSLLSGRLVLNDAVFPHWIDDNACFWYQRETRDEGKRKVGNRHGEGKEFRWVDASTGSNAQAFDHQVLADVLIEHCEQASQHNCEAWNLPIQDLSMSLTPREVRFQAFGQHWLFETDTCQLQEMPEEQKIPHTELPSPDGKKIGFVRDHNL